MKTSKFFFFSIVGSFLFLCACGTSYTTPGASVNISEQADEEVAKVLNTEPTTTFPARIAIARIQSPNYTNYKNKKYSPYRSNNGYSMVLTREVQEDEVFRQINDWDGVAVASPFNRLLLPYEYKTIKDLRIAAAKMKAQMLLVYTFDTQYIVDTKNFGPQNVIALGYLKNKEVKVVTTASAALFDVQTEYLYGLAEETASETKKSNAWKKVEELDALRLNTEATAFQGLVKNVASMWEEVLKEYNQ